MLVIDSLEPLRDDYRRFLREYDLTEAQVRRIVEDMSDHADMPLKFQALRVGPSAIQGVGTFAARHIEDGELIALARVGKNRTFAGRRTNHSPVPNCRFELDDPHCFFGNLMMTALRDIAAGEELTVNYRQAAEIAGLRPMEALCP